MTAYELRNHLRDRHTINLHGADYSALLAIHDAEHQHGQDHDHGDDTDAA